MEFSERGADAIVDGQVGDEFVVAAAQVLHESVSGGDGTQRTDRFQSAHRSQPGFQPAVISFDDVVNQYEDLGVAGFAGRSCLVWGCWSAYGATVRDRGAGSEAGWAGRCYALG